MSKGPGDVATTPVYQDPSLTDLSGYIRRSGDPSDPTAVQQSQGAFEALTKAMGVPLTVETIGIPIVFPGMIAAVTGLGFRLSTPTAGTYGIRKVRHTLGTNGYTTTLEMTSNVGSFLSKQISLPADGPQQSQNAPTGNSGSSTTVQPKPG